MKKLKSIINYFAPVLTIIVLLLLWQLICTTGFVPAFMLPAPTDILYALADDFSLLMSNAAITLTEALVGLAIGIVLSFIISYFMDRFDIVYRCSYPLLVISQTVPAVAIAPLLVLWMGYGMAPKIALIVIVTFFPISIGLLNGFRSVPESTLGLFDSLGANKRQIFWHLKFPYALGSFFSGLKISVSYSIVGAVVAEWLGGTGGLGVYMTRVRKSYSFDKMFAVIFIIIVVSLLLMFFTSLLQKKITPWLTLERKQN